MATVGLSFGSPTSGAGFDVSSTVSQIVSNLQQIETPWKNQLTALENQDTVISNLGSLLSALSTDVSQLTDFQGTLAQKTGQSSDTNVLELSSASSLASAGTHTVVVNNLAQTSSGYLAPVADATDTLSGSITLKTGNGTAMTFTIGAGSSSGNTIYTGSGNDTLSDLASAINSSGAGINAGVLTDSSGSRLSLVSATSGAKGNISVSANSIADATSSSGILAYSAPVSGKDASLTVDGVDLTSASNTVTNLIPGLTFQLLSASPAQSDGNPEPVQIVIANNNSSVETAVNQMVTDYNALMKAITAQEGKDSSGNPEPLFGSPTLSLLQQRLMNGLNLQSPNGTLDAISSTGTTLADQSQITIQTPSGASATFIIGSGSDSAVPGTYYTDDTDAGGVSNGNTLSGLAATINAASRSRLSYSGTAGTTTTTSSGSLTGISDTNHTLSGSISIQVGSGTAQTFTLDSSDNTLAGLQDTINGAQIGVTASIVQDSTTGLYGLSLESGTPGTDGTLKVTSSILDLDAVGVNAGVATANGKSTLTLASQTEGANGALTVNSELTAVTAAALSYSDTQGYTTTTADSGTLGAVKSSSDALSGSVTFEAGGGAPATVTMDEVNAAEGGTTLADLASYIQTNYSSAVDAETVTNSDGTLSLSLTAQADGSAGALTVASNLFDTNNTSSTPLNYSNSSDINSLTTLGINVNNDGTLTFDASALDSTLNSDFNGVVGFFQSVDSWGQLFNTMVDNAGSSFSTGILALAAKSNSNIEASLNSKIKSEDALIATQQTKLTAELNQANQVLQELPSQLNSVNELYSAISGYNRGTNG